MQLNPKQWQAVTAKTGTGLVLAGAGSGKTRVLTQRILHLLQDQGVSPWRILAVTFTNKAAGEMRERLCKTLGNQARDLWISTFHSSCLRILRRHAERLGFAKQFAIYDTSDQLTLVKKIVQTLDLNDKMFPPKALLKHIDAAKNNGISSASFSAGGDYFLGKVAQVYELYQKELRQNQAMDFGDLILNTIILFQTCPDVLEQYQNQFEHILVDEYQDTNLVQYQLIKLLAAKWRNVIVVGDDDQSIYRFRGAEIGNILNFQKDYPDAWVIRLEQNYRSTKTILNASNAVIRNNRSRMGKELWTENTGGEAVKIFRATDERQEAQYIAEQIAKKRQDHSLREVAVFYRTNAQSRAIEDELRKKNLSYKIFGGMRFYDRAEIRDLMAYLQVILNPQDGVSLKRIINVPARGIGKTTLEKLDNAASSQNASLWNLLEAPAHTRWGLEISASVAKKLRDFFDLIQSLQKAESEMPLTEFLPHVLEEVGYWQMLKAENTIESESRRENLSEFVNVAQEFLDENPEARLAGFLDQISLASDVDGLDENADYVTLMTIHLAKGLEFPLVFIAGLEEGLFPHVRSLDDENDMEEERRICYVAMTRAMQELTLSYADVRRIFGTAQYNQPSRFLREIPEECVEEVSLPNWSLGLQKPQQRFPIGVQKGGSQAALKTSDRHIDVSESQLDVPFPKGSLVEHQVFGRGRVQNYLALGDQSKVTVHFQNGAVKTLSLKFAHLTLLDS